MEGFRMKLMFASDIHGSLFYAEKVAEAYKNEKAEKLILCAIICRVGIGSIRTAENAV